MALSTVAISPLPDVESALMFALVPLHPEVRFVTVMPAGQLKMLTARINRVAGAERHFVDTAIVDIDVWGFSSKPMDVSIAARDIQASIVGLMGQVVTNGVIQHVATISGPRAMPEVNQTLTRYNASYQVRLHATP